MTNTNKPLVSILMTVYNREKYIAEAIKSVVASTYQNWELIIVDDCSKDNSVNIAKSYEIKDDRIKVYENEINLGDYPNRNKAASYAKGKYLKYVDADDMIYPYGLDQLVFYMEQFPGVGYGLSSLCQDDMNIYPIILTPIEAYQKEYIDKKTVFHLGPTFSIIKRSVFEEFHGFAKVRHYGDSELWLRISKQYSMLQLNEGVIWYRRTEGQEGSLRKNNPLIWLKELKSEKNNLKLDCPLNAKQVENITNQINYNMSRAILVALKTHSLSKMIEMKQFSGLSWYRVFTILLSYKLKKNGI